MKVKLLTCNQFAMDTVPVVGAFMLNWAQTSLKIAHLMVSAMSVTREWKISEKETEFWAQTAQKLIKEGMSWILISFYVSQIS